MYDDTIIVVALVVIFIPEILDGEKRRSQERFEVIPERPQMKEIVEAEEFPFDEVQGSVTREVEIIDESPVDDDTTATAEQIVTNSSVNSITNTVVQSTSEPVMEPKTETVQAGWVVQLGSFRHQKNVRELLRKLEQAGYRVFTRPIQTSSGRLTKVFVGPDLDQSKLQKAVPHLKEITGLQGRISPFTVD